MATSTQIDHKINQFFSQYPLKNFDKGEILILDRQNPEYIYHLVKGNVKVYDISYRGDVIVVNVFKPPAFFPMSWPIAKTPNRYFFETIDKVKVHLAPPEDALEFIKANPDVMLDLLIRLYRGIDGMQRRMAHLMGGSAKSRLLFELIIESRRFGKVQKDGSYLIKISEADIGSRAGLSRETVSREMKELKKLNLITIDRQGIQLKNVDALDQELGSNL